MTRTNEKDGTVVLEFTAEDVALALGQLAGQWHQDLAQGYEVTAPTSKTQPFFGKGKDKPFLVTFTRIP